jgi:uncharacterized protein (TIGR02996 family)
MTKEEDAFLRAIRQNPDDQLTRLVYADWLDERGDLRGEYIRLCCRLAEVRGQIDPAWRRAVQESEFRYDIRLASGRWIYLNSLRQERVYAGLLEGLPTRDLNQGIIDRLVEGERRAHPHDELPPLLLTPEQRPIKHSKREYYPFGEPAQLPEFSCVGHFISHSPARNMGMMMSTLTVIWFQDEFAPPIGPDVWPQFRAIDWDQHAEDGDY